MFRECYVFGGVTFALESDVPFDPVGMCSPFACGNVAADHTVGVTYSAVLPCVPAGAMKSGIITRWYDGGARHTLRLYDASVRLRFSYAVNRGQRTDVVFAESYRGTVTSRAIFEAAGLFELLADAGMPVLHSSYIISDGYAILFSGPSGIGKSTQAALWEKYRGAVTVNGDRTLIDPAAGTANGIFYAGTSGICKNITAPLRAVVILRRGGHTELRRAEPREAFKAILCQSAYYSWDPVSVDRMTELAARVVNGTEIFCMDCPPDRDSVLMLDDELRKER